MSQNVYANLNDADFEELEKLAHELEIDVKDLVKNLIIYGLYFVEDIPKLMRDSKTYKWFKH